MSEARKGYVRKPERERKREKKKKEGYVRGGGGQAGVRQVGGAAASVGWLVGMGMGRNRPVVPTLSQYANVPLIIIISYSALPPDPPTNRPTFARAVATVAAVSLSHGGIFAREGGRSEVSFGTCGGDSDGGVLEVKCPT